MLACPQSWPQSAITASPASSPTSRRHHFECACKITQALLSKLAAISNDHGLGCLARLGAHALDFLYNVHALRHAAEDDVLAIQPGCLHRAQEELRSVGVGARV